MGSEEDASIPEGLALNMPVETDGALHGGVTTFGHFVGQRNEPLVPNIETTVREGNRWSRVDYFFHAIVSTDGHHAELPAVWALGITSFKPFFNAYKPRPTERLSWLGGPSDGGCCCGHCASAPSAARPPSASSTARTLTSSLCSRTS